MVGQVKIICVTDGRNRYYVDIWTDDIPSWAIDYFIIKEWNYEHLLS